METPHLEKAHSKLIEYGTTLNREQRQDLIDELLILFNVSQQRELLKKWWKYFDEESVAINCNNDEREEVINDFFKMLQESKDLYSKAIDRWGKGSQLEMLIEEMAELTLALQKFKRNPSKDKGFEVCDEIADVEIMLEQCKLIFSEEMIQQRKDFKLQRLGNTLKDTMYSKYQMDDNKIEDNT
jgi:hypothetical protein